MHYEIKKYLWCCECCGKKEIVESNSPTKPDGWQMIRTHGWGLTGYSKEQDFCPECLETCDMCNGERRVPRCDSTISNANMQMCPKCDGVGKTVKKVEASGT